MNIPTTTLPLNALTPHPENYNTHPASQIKELAESLSTFGQFKNIVTWTCPENMTTPEGHELHEGLTYILAGHGLWLAAMEAGVDELEVKDYSGLSYDMAIGLLLVDNAAPLGSVPIVAALASLLERAREPMADKPRLAEMLQKLKERAGINGNGQPPKDVEPQIDKAKELQGVWGTELGQIWQLGNHRLAVGDCTDRATVEAVMRGERADLWIADPPYGIGWQGSNASTLEWKEIDGDKDTKTVTEFFRILSPEQMAVVWGANCFPELLPHRGRWICWDKRVTEEADRMIGSPFELAWMNKTHGFDVIIRVQHGGALNADGGDRYHPTQKPVKLYASVLDDTYNDAKVVFDPFLGSGTTLIAAHQLGRVARGIEIDPGYAAVSIQRFVDLTGIEPKRISQ